MGEYWSLGQLAEWVEPGPIEQVNFKNPTARARSRGSGYFRRPIHLEGDDEHPDLLGYVCANSVDALDGAENDPRSVPHGFFADMMKEPEHLWWCLNPEGISIRHTEEPAARRGTDENDDPLVVSYDPADGMRMLLQWCRGNVWGYELPDRYFQDSDLVHLEHEIRESRQRIPIGMRARRVLREPHRSKYSTTRPGALKPHPRPWKYLFDVSSALDEYAEGNDLLAIVQAERTGRERFGEAGAKAARYLLEELVLRIDFHFR